MHAARRLTVGYNPFIKSQHASQTQLEGFMWCKFCHEVVTFPSELKGTHSSYSTVGIPHRT